MQLKDVPQSIMQSINRFEANLGIKTLEIHKINETERVAYFHAIKSDNTITFFIAVKLSGYSDDSWRWFCPTEEMAQALKKFGKLYDDVQNRNHILRGAAK